MTDMPTMKEAFRTTVSGAGNYEMVFRFKSMEDMHRADDEWREWRGTKSPDAYGGVSAGHSGPCADRRPSRWDGVTELVDLICSDEGATVTFVGQNPDFNGLPNECVFVCGPTTGWKDRDFRADTLADCLRAALVAPDTQAQGEEK